MIHIFCSRPSNSAKALVLAIRALGEKAKRRRAGQGGWRAVPQVGDLIVEWGEGQPLEPPLGVQVLNGVPNVGKWEELAILRDAGIRTPPFISTTPPPGEGWLGRKNNHQGGKDLLHPPGNPDYWVKRLQLDREFRVHVMNGLIIRLGEKVPDGENPHPWIRSRLGGWRVVYGLDRAEIPKGVRSIAKAAINALGLSFGAADVGVGENVLVLEVNRAPGLEPTGVRLYAEQLVKISKEGAAD